MDIYFQIAPWREQREADKAAGLSLGIVPTMGALHAGHLSLVKRSQSESDRTLVTLFVNPTQFDQASDLDNYPHQLEADIEMLRKEGVDYLLIPEPGAIYPDQFRFRVTENEQSQILCGAHRPGHFDGVLTVVLKLLNLSEAHRAYFGEKDFQQLQLIKDMATAFFINCEIIPCPLVRENDGLAMSSRNQRLNSNQRQLAPRFFHILRSSPSSQEAIRELQNEGFAVDYVEEHWGRRLAAVRLGEIRLIDNVKI